MSTAELGEKGEEPTRAVINRRVLERLRLYSDLGPDGWQGMRHPDPELQRQAQDIETHHGGDEIDDDPPPRAKTRRKIRRKPGQ